MKEERVARPDVLSYEQGRQRQRMIFQPINIKDLPKEIEKLIQQAKAEVAREIFDYFDMRFRSYEELPKGIRRTTFAIDAKDYREFQSKFLNG